MLCGLEPQIATSISKFIYDIVTNDERVQKYRRTIDFEKSHEQLISDIQECIVNCIDEVKACETPVQSSFDLGDLIGIWSDTDHFERQIISPDSVISLEISKHNTYKSLPCLPKYQRLEAIRIFSSAVFMADEGFKYICDAIENNTSTLKSLLVVEWGMRRYIGVGLVYRTIVHRLPDMSHLVALRIGDGGIQHEDFISLCTFLSGSSHLKQIAISRISCEYSISRERNTRREPSTVSAPSTVSEPSTVSASSTVSEPSIVSVPSTVSEPSTVTAPTAASESSTDSESSTVSKPTAASEFSTDSERSTNSVFLDQHEVDLSKHQQLQYLEYDDSVTVTRVNTSNLEIFKCYSLNSTNVKVFDNLSTANKLTKLLFWYGNRLDENSSYHTVTDKLIKMLPSLHQLRDLTLLGFTFTGNIMKFPSEMKNMKSINLELVRMSLTTWRQFVNSLPLVQLPLEVRALDMCITREGDECNPFIMWCTGGKEEAAAWRYVREHEALFNVEHEEMGGISFSTKSIIQR